MKIEIFEGDKKVAEDDFERVMALEPEQIESYLDYQEMMGRELRVEGTPCPRIAYQV